MDNASDKDVTLSHRILNYLRAGYQGEHTFMKAMRELGSPEINDEALARHETTMQRIEQWYLGLGKGDCLFSAAWKTPQTFEAKKAIEWLEGLYSVVGRASAALRDLSSSPDWLTSKDKTRRLASHMARYAYSAKVYAIGMVDLANLKRDQQASERFQAQLGSASAEATKASACVAVIKEHGKLPPELKTQFLNDIQLAAGALASQAHDIVQILSPYKGGDSYVAGTFEPSIAKLWEAAKIPLVEAGYWRAYGFSPTLARQWVDVQVPLAAIAFIWGAAGFEPGEAAQWSVLSISPEEARDWISAGITFEQAASFIKKGFRSPAQLPKGD